ncbi:MAG: hypothetical protein MR346_07625 [Clostridium sp.]|nr:hypothetical protein [Clostridium sp.]
MATQLDVIYNKFLSQIDDIELSLLMDNDLEDLLMDYLENATVEFRECKKDLTIIKPFENEYEFSRGRSFSINTLFNEYTKVTVRDGMKKLREDIDYSIDYDKTLLELNITLKSDPKDKVVIEILSEGSVEADLTLEEIYILALSMKLFWLSPKIHREENLRQMMNDRDFNQLSNANMLKVLLQLHTATRQELQKFKQRYAMKDFQGLD